MGKTLKFIDANFEVLFLIVFYIYFCIAIFSVAIYGFFNVATWKMLLVGWAFLNVIWGGLKKALNNPYAWMALCMRDKNK